MLYAVNRSLSTTSEIEEKKQHLYHKSGLIYDLFGLFPYQQDLVPRGWDTCHCSHYNDPDLCTMLSLEPLSIEVWSESEGPIGGRIKLWPTHRRIKNFMQLGPRRLTPLFAPAALSSKEWSSDPKTIVTHRLPFGIWHLTFDVWHWYLWYWHNTVSFSMMDSEVILAIR